VIVLDASVLVGVLVGRADTVELVERALGGATNEAFHAPELIEPESLNALRRLVLARAITRDRAEQAVSHLAALRLIRYPHAPLRPRVWGLRDALSAYDATYVALAAVLDDAVLLTADRGLAMVAENVLGADRVRHLA
jgi:predicted nucleic acid-binding protein